MDEQLQPETSEKPEFIPSKITVRNSNQTLAFIRQEALSGGKVLYKDIDSAKDIFDFDPNKVSDNSCILLKNSSEPNKTTLIGHFDKKNYGISFVSSTSSTILLSDLKVQTGAVQTYELQRDITEALLVRFTEKFNLIKDPTGAVTITTPHGYNLALNTLTFSSFSTINKDKLRAEFDFAVSTAKIKQLVQGSYGKKDLADFQDETTPVTDKNLQIYLDDMMNIHDEARRVFADFGFNISPIKQEVISRPKRETTIADNIRAQLGEVSENFVIREPNVKFEDVIGHEDILRDLRNVVSALKDPEAKNELLELPHGILLHGLPGCGKTYIAEAVARESDCYFLYIQPSMLFDQPVAKDIIKVLFEEIKERDKPTMIFIDEADTFFRSRDLLSQQRAELVSAFLAQLDGIGRNNNGFLVLASNRPDLIDPAVKRSGRIDYICEVKPPTRGDRMQLFRYFISKVGNSSERGFDPQIFDESLFDEEGIIQLAAATEENGSGTPVTQAEIKGIINHTLLERRNKEGKPSVKLQDILYSIALFKENKTNR